MVLAWCMQWIGRMDCDLTGPSLLSLLCTLPQTTLDVPMADRIHPQSPSLEVVRPFYRSEMS